MNTKPLLACKGESALLVVLQLICTACAMAPNGGLPVNSSAPGIAVPSATRVLGQATVYLAATGERLEVVHDTRTGVAIVKSSDGAITVLPAEIAGSEERYRDSRMTLWEKEGSALLWIDGKLVFSGRETN